VTLTGALLYGEVGVTTGLAPSIAATLLQPLLDWGRRRAAVDFARASHHQALLAFSEELLVAIEEVETTLWQEAQQRDRIETLARRVELLEQTVTGTRWRYAQGITDYLPVFTAVRDLQAAQRELLTQRRVLVSLRVQLHGALGGLVPPTQASVAPATAP
jgi:outer membrane protein TolC